jgi:hypothetical protein
MTQTKRDRGENHDESFTYGGWVANALCLSRTSMGVALQPANLANGIASLRAAMRKAEAHRL